MSKVSAHSLTANGWLDDVAAIKPCGLGLALCAASLC